MADRKAPLPQGAPRACPICGKPASDAYVPFCSKHCADVDLHRWLSGVYAVPSAEEADDGDGAPRPSDAD